jgi:hypothetical protein
MRASVLLLAALAACGPRPGTVQARWETPQGEVKVDVRGKAGWCPETRTILVDATQQDDAVGVFWRYTGGGPVPGALELGPPPDSTGEGAPANAALRYVHLDEIRGYRSLSGTLTLGAADSSAVSGTLTARMQRVGEADTTPLAMEFHAVPLVRDATVCVAPPAPPADSTTDSL